MLRTLAAFLLIFWLLGVVVHLDGLAVLFGAGALVLFVIDLLLPNSEKRLGIPRPRRSLR